MINSLGSCAVEDIHCLNLQVLAWCKVKTGIYSAEPRYNFASFSKGKHKYNLNQGSKIYIFGGVSETSFLSGVVEVLETNEIEAFHINRIYKLEKLKKKRQRKPQREGVYIDTQEVNFVSDQLNKNQTEDDRNDNENDIALRKIQTQNAMLEVENERKELLKKMAKSSRTRDFVSYMPYPLASHR